MSHSSCVDWLFGRGLSIGCGLSWSIPIELVDLSREEKINKIKHRLRQEMDAPYVNTESIRNLLEFLAKNTETGWSHEFVTTNWDYLLQREILNLRLTAQPSWLANSHVFHLNGTVEVQTDNSHRSPFLLEEDPANLRTVTTEANKAYNSMIVHRTFAVIGMSFECETDKFLLTALNRVEDDMPIGESTWMVVNPDQSALKTVCSRISSALPSATVYGVPTTLNEWINAGLPELKQCGALAF